MAFQIEKLEKPAGVLQGYGKSGCEEGGALAEGWDNRAPGEKKFAFGVRKEAMYVILNDVRFPCPNENKTADYQYQQQS